MDTYVFSQPASAYLKAVGWIPLIALPRGVGELAHTGSKEPTVCIIPNSELSDHEMGHGGSIYTRKSKNTANQAFVSSERWLLNIYSHITDDIPKA